MSRPNYQPTISSIQRFIKNKVKWKPYEGGPIWKEYDGERYLLLASFNDKNPEVFEVANFVDSLKLASTIMKWNCAFHSVVYDIENDFVFVIRKVRPRFPDDEWWNVWMKGGINED